MSDHKFKVGQSVLYTSGPYGRGGGVYKIKRVAEHSEVHDNSTYGVLRLVLLPGKYEWTFLAVEGQPFTDAGSGTCSPVRNTR